MKTLKVSPGLLPSVIHIPPSKSYANRALILASISSKNILIKNMPKASDVTFLLSALKKIGLEIQEDKDTVRIQNSFPQCEIPNGSIIEIGEGGTTARFLASMLLLGSQPYTLILGERLKDRPWQEFILLANKLGAQAELQGNKLTLRGPIKFVENVEIDCSETTQFASGLQLALAFTQTKVTPLDLKSSESYWEMTKVIIEELKLKDEFFVPMDWSSASYPMAFGALRQNIFFPGLKHDPFQADAKFFSILNQLGAVQETPEGLRVKPNITQKDFSLDVSDCLDLVPALAFLLAHIDGTHELLGIKNLVHKESNRLEEVMKLLEEFGFKSSSDGFVLHIEGSHSLRGVSADLQLPDDHRMVMTGAMFLRYHQGGSVTPSSAVDKSYPDFFKLFGP
jgi:3-phosphoshikimate 1-carboxyvinyltransferase